MEGRWIDEWHAVITKRELGVVTAALYEVQEDGQFSMLAVEDFGPFDTATDVLAWLVRHWSPRASRPMR